MKIIWKTKCTRIIQVTLCSLLVSWLVKLFIFAFYAVPSESMEPVLWPNDELLVSKYTYGARLDFKSLFTFQKSTLGSRLPGWTHIRSQDIVVFNAPYDYDITLVKRCIATAGDTLVIKNSNVYINGKQLDASAIYYDFVLESRDGKVTDKAITDLGIRPDSVSYSKGQKRYFLSMTRADRTILAGLKTTQNIYRDTSAERNNKYIFPKVMRGSWDKNNYGPLVIPKRNKTIWLDRESISKYYSVFRFEQKNIADSNGHLYINNRPVRSYTFKNDYYFVMGDNRDRSFDSRWIGLVPENLIIGKAIYVFNFGKLGKSDRGRIFRFLN